jgi:hypothetical protein
MKGAHQHKLAWAMYANRSAMHCPPVHPWPKHEPPVSEVDFPHHSPDTQTLTQTYPFCYSYWRRAAERSASDDSNAHPADVTTSVASSTSVTAMRRVSPILSAKSQNFGRSKVETCRCEEDPGGEKSSASLVSSAQATSAQTGCACRSRSCDFERCSRGESSPCACVVHTLFKTRPDVRVNDAAVLHDVRMLRPAARGFVAWVVRSPLPDMSVDALLGVSQSTESTRVHHTDV